MTKEDWKRDYEILKEEFDELRLNLAASERERRAALEELSRMRIAVGTLRREMEAFLAK